MPEFMTISSNFGTSRKIPYAPLECKTPSRARLRRGYTSSYQRSRSLPRLVDAWHIAGNTTASFRRRLALWGRLSDIRVGLDARSGVLSCRLCPPRRAPPSASALLSPFLWRSFEILKARSEAALALARSLVWHLLRVFLFWHGLSFKFHKFTSVS